MLKIKKLSQVTDLMTLAQDNIIKLKMVAVDTTDDWDSGEATNSVFHENFQAKETIKQAQEIITTADLNEKQEDLWRLDDQRAFESRAAWLRVRRRKLGLPDVQWVRSSANDKLFVFANCEVIGNRFVYEVTIKNASDFVITNVTTTLVAYPKDCMRLAADPVKITPRIEVEGFEVDKFVLLPSKDCVEGRLVCVVSYIDYRDHLHTIHVQPYIIRSVCDLLQPFESSVEQFGNTFQELIGGSREFTLEWNAEVLLDKAETVLPAMNFYLVDVEKKDVGDSVVGSIRGYAIGKYTHKRVAVVIHITGEKDGTITTAKVSISGDDEAMFPTTLGEIAEKIDSWVCLKCGARLNPDQVMEIEVGASLECRYCKSTLTLDLYIRTDTKPNPGRSVIISEELPEGISSVSDFETSKVIDEDSTSNVEGINVLRGCEIVGGKFDYKVKVQNDSEYVITNVVVTIVGFPKDAISLSGECASMLPRIEVGGFRSPQFSFTPSKDCVEGSIIATVSFIDFKDNVHTLHVEPYIIKSVCDMLQPLEATPKELEKVFSDFDCSDQEFDLQWNAGVTFNKIRRLLPSKNFYIVNQEVQEMGTSYVGKISGFAEGKYSGKRIAAIITVRGESNGRSCTINIEILGDDLTMLPTTIVELSSSITAWTCLFCYGSLSTESVLKLKARTTIKCEHCTHSLTLDLYEMKR
jgi:DNA-directed RNA polymerase subunit RPC12/RpoP